MTQSHRRPGHAGSPALHAAISAVLATATGAAAAQESTTSLGEVIVTATRRAALRCPWDRAWSRHTIP